MTAAAQARSTFARWALGGHVALIAFATLAMVTILAGAFPVWMQGPYTAQVYDYAWRFTGQAYVALGLAAAVAHATPHIGWRRALAMFALASLVALASELAGTNFGLPFGAYHYTTMLGFRVLGDVPYVIPMSWAYMLYASLALCARRARLRGGALTGSPWSWALAAGAMLTAWDVALEVHMTRVSPPHWAWDFDRMPGWIPDVLTTPIYYGMPLVNWVGWLVTATLIARLMLWIVPRDRWMGTLSVGALPAVLYAANGVMPIAATARHGLWGAAGLGVVAMGFPLVWAMRRPKT